MGYVSKENVSRNEKKTYAKFDINSAIETSSSIIFHSKTCHFGSGQIKSFGLENCQCFNPIHTGLYWLLAGVVPGGGCFPPPLCNSFVFKVRRLSYVQNYFWGRINILGLEQSGSNQ